MPKTLTRAPRSASRRPGKGLLTPAAEAYVWELPDEKPGTLKEIFAAEDSRRQNLVLYEIRKVDGFRKCWEAIGAAGDPYHLILAVVICVAFHLRPEYRVADHRRELRMAARHYEKAAMALEELARSTDRVGRVEFLTGLRVAGLSDPTDPRMIAHLRNIAASLDRLLTRGVFKDTGGRPRMRAFAGLIWELAQVFENATANRGNDYGTSIVPAAIAGDFGISSRLSDRLRPRSLRLLGPVRLRNRRPKLPVANSSRKSSRKFRTEKTRAASQ